jgi:hypothetical protein
VLILFYPKIKNFVSLRKKEIKCTI